jgi:tripartite ATP-independent transporter DctM subunit
VASMIFAGTTGSNLAEAAGLGKIEVKAMTEAGYSRTFSAAITAASSTLGPIIPPSIILLVYGTMTGTSVGRLFLGGLLPGILCGLLLMVQIFWYAKTGRQKCPLAAKTSIHEKLTALRRGILPCLTPVIIIMGMTSGLFTATEAGVIAVVYSAILALIYKTIKFKDILPMLARTAVSTAFILFLVACSGLLSYVLTLEQIPDQILGLLGQFQAPPLIIFILINVFLLILGMFINGTPALLIVLPVLMPLSVKLGIDPVQFGMVICYNLVVGCVTPPVGFTLFVMVDVAKVTYEEISKAIMPFLIPLVICLLLLTFMPQITLFLPNMLMP